MPAPAWTTLTSSDDKLTQILEYVKILNRKVEDQSSVIRQLREENAVLKNDHTAMKVRMATLEEENQVLREAVDGVCSFR
jgi:cell division protein FtsB